MEYAVILAGGKGERLWPLSREKRPKQLINVYSGKTLIEETIDRLQPRIPLERILIVCNRSLAQLMVEATSFLTMDNFIVEPQGRNSAPAIYLAAAYLSMLDPNATMLIFPADHYIAPVDQFLATIDEAIQLALHDSALVTIGIVPTYPETGFGYIIRRENGEVERFMEKPDFETASHYIEAGNAFWNSGMFIWKVDTLISAVRQWQPMEHEIFQKLIALTPLELKSGQTETVFSQFTATSIDYAIMEKAANVRCVSARFDWNDVGCWLSLEKILKSDQTGNVIHGQGVCLESEGNVVYAGDNRLIATVGLRDSVVVAVDNIVLVCPKDRSQEVKKILCELHRHPEWIGFR